MTRKYAAFISYRHCPLDIAVAQKIHKSIERFKIPRDLRREEAKNPGSVFTNWKGESPEGNLLVFRDREELPLSNDLTSDIFTALDNTKCLIVICTPDTPKSLWVRREISYFIEKHGRQRIITVLAAGTPEESIPKEITTVYAEDGTTVLEEYEPLVAYVTADSTRKVLKNLDKEMLRLCAAILGCPYDALRQRHKRRKMQQTMAAITAAFLVALSFIGMLINRNLEIDAQKKSVQLRESELLAADAEEALQAGDALGAIESAVNALPKEGEEDRPYYAPAERVLMESMDILGGAEAPVLLKEMQLKQMTPIGHFCLSPDGTLAVTIDIYGILHCFDTLSGEELWNDVMDYDITGGNSRYVTMSDDNRFLFCNYYSLLECRDPRTGEVLWTYHLEHALSGCLFYDHPHNQIALVQNYFSSSVNAYCVDLTLIDAETGKNKSHMVIDTVEFGVNNSLAYSDSVRQPQNGVFSEDGKYLALAFSREEQEDACLRCFVVDLEKRKVVMDYTQDLPDGESYFITGADLREKHLFLSLESSDDTIAATVIKLDWHQGTLLWSTTTPAELEESTFTIDQTSSVLFWETVAIVGRYERLYAIDLVTGEVLNSIQLHSTLNYLYTVSSRYFAFSLADGTYAIGWYGQNNGFTLSSDPFWQVTAEVGPHNLLKPYKGGIVQVYTDGNYLEMSVSNVEQEGYLALVGSSTRNQLTVKRPITVEKPIEQTTISLPVEQDRIYCSESDAVLCSDGTWLLGLFNVDLEDGGTRYFYAAMDPETHQVTGILDVDYDYRQEIHILPDGSGYLQYVDGTTRLHCNGSSEPIVQSPDPLSTEMSEYEKKLVVTDTVRLADGNLLTAHCDTDSMILMVNGEKQQDIGLPQEHCYDAFPEQYRYRQVYAGKNGCVLTYCHNTTEQIPSENLALYHPGSGWGKLTESFTFSNSSALAFASANSHMALADDGNQIRVFDLETGSQTIAFPLTLPYRSVLFMDFILNDSCLLLKTKDAQILVYDLATGEIIFHDKLGSTYTGILRTYVDAENQRLYIIDSNCSSNPNCLCIDLRSWTTLGYSNRVIFFDETRRELFHSDYHHDAQDSLSCMRIPDTRELVQLGQQMLAVH